MYIPNVGDKVKLKLFEDYMQRKIGVWAWLKVQKIEGERATLQVLDGNTETEQVVEVPMSVIDPPLCWEEVYDVTAPDQRAKFETWIKERGGICVWGNYNLSNPGAGNMYTPARDPESADNTKSPPHWGHGLVEVVTDLKRFRFIKELKEVKRVKIALRRSTNGMTIKLTDASTRKVRKACEKAGKGTLYMFDYGTQEAVIMLPIWEETTS